MGFSRPSQPIGGTITSPGDWGIETVIQSVRTIVEQLSKELSEVHWSNAPSNEEELRKQFALKRGYVNLLVHRVMVKQDKSLVVDLAMNLENVATGFGKELLIPIIQPRSLLYSTINNLPPGRK